MGHGDIFFHVDLGVFTPYKSFYWYEFFMIAFLS